APVALVGTAHAQADDLAASKAAIRRPPRRDPAARPHRRERVRSVCAALDGLVPVEGRCLPLRRPAIESLDDGIEGLLRDPQGVGEAIDLVWPLDPARVGQGASAPDDLMPAEAGDDALPGHGIEPRLVDANGAAIE